MLHLIAFLHGKDPLLKPVSTHSHHIKRLHASMHNTHHILAATLYEHIPRPPINIRVA